MEKSGGMTVFTVRKTKGRGKSEVSANSTDEICRSRSNEGKRGKGVELV